MGIRDRVMRFALAWAVVAAVSGLPLCNGAILDGHLLLHASLRMSKDRAYDILMSGTAAERKAAARQCVAAWSCDTDAAHRSLGELAGANLIKSGATKRMTHGARLVIAFDHVRSFDNVSMPADRGEKQTGPERQARIKKALGGVVSAALCARH